ncbi:MAG: PKD domain-containing protein [Planctomycetota bacterium]|nr:PKD domain-containing protein [Planctomycetota bacterium]
MRVLAIGIGLVLGTLLLVSIGALVPTGPAPILGGVSAPVESAAIPAQVRHAAPLVLSAKNKPETFVKLAERQSDRARNIHENFEAAMNLAGALQKAGKPDAAVDDALRRAADFAECLPAGTLGANGRPTPFSGPEGGARTLLAQAHREIVHGEQAAARRHLELLLERYAEASPALAEQARADLARLDSGEQAAGAPRALAGAKEEKLLGNRKPATGNQQPSTGIAAREVSPVQTTLVLATSEANTVIFSGAENGKTYTISAAGTWAQDPDPQFDTGPEGLASFGTISGGPFAGMFFGTFAAQEPGSGSWQAIGASGSITATADGEILGSFADILGLYGDNNGALFVTVSEEGFEPPPGATAPPLADAQVTPDTVCVYYASTNVALDGSLSADADAEGDAPALRWFHWRLVNLTNPAVRPLVYEGPDSFAFPSGLNQPGAYEVTLRVVDNEGELGTAVRTLTAVGIVFDPPSLEVAVGSTAASNAEVIPASAADGISFEFSVPDVANFQATNAGAGVIEVQIEGVAEGSTELIAQVQGEFGPENCEALFLSVVPPSNTTPPVAIAETATPVICAGGTVTLDGSGSHDTDTVNDSLGSPQILAYEWTVTNSQDPESQQVFSTTDPVSSFTVPNPGEYVFSLVVTDNDGQKSLQESSYTYFVVMAIDVQATPSDLQVPIGQSRAMTITVMPEEAFDLVGFQSVDPNIASISSVTRHESTADILINGNSSGESAIEIVSTQVPSYVICQSTTVIVQEKVEGLTLNTKPESLIFCIGENVEFIARHTDGTVTINLTISGGDPDPVTVSGKKEVRGKVKASHPGFIEAVASGDDGTDDKLMVLVSDTAVLPDITVERGRKGKFRVRVCDNSVEPIFSNWQFEAREVEIQRDGNNNEDAWEGEFATTGKVSVNVQLGQRKIFLQSNVFVTAREFDPVHDYRRVKNRGNDGLPEFPRANGDLGQSRPNLSSKGDWKVRTITNGPNKGYIYLVKFPRVRWDWEASISDALFDKKHPFYIAQGDLPQATIEQVQENVLVHEGVQEAEGFNSHWSQGKLAVETTHIETKLEAVVIHESSGSGETLAQIASFELGQNVSEIRDAIDPHPQNVHPEDADLQYPQWLISSVDLRIGEELSLEGNIFLRPGAAPVIEVEGKGIELGLTDGKLRAVSKGSGKLRLIDFEDDYHEIPFSVK